MNGLKVFSYLVLRDLIDSEAAIAKNGSRSTA